MKSCLYIGQVRHRRFRVRDNRFNYSIFMPFLNVDELDQVSRDIPFFSVNQFNWLQFRRSDYLPDYSDMSLREAVQKKLFELTGYQCSGPVMMLGQLRYLGVYFSPINCFYCYDDQGQLAYLLAEVSNTPWLEKHYYAVSCEPGVPQMQPKLFHVSPFMNMDMNYVWRWKVPSEKLFLHIENRDQTGKLFDATLTMIQKPLTSRNLLRELVKTPVLTAAVVIKIYWQALKLWVKGVPYVPYNKGIRNE